MKRTTFILAYFVVTTSLFSQNNGNGPMAVSVIRNENAAYLYKINTENWGDNAFSIAYNNNEQFTGQNFGTPDSLFLDGGVAVAWAANGDYFMDDSFVIQYRVYPSAGTAPDSWNILSLSFLAGQQGSDYKYDTNGRKIDILSLATDPGVYNFDVRLVRKHYWGAGSNWTNTYTTQTATFAVVDERPIANFEIFTVGLSNTSLTFNNTSSNADSYSWNFGDETFESTDVNPTHTFTSPGTYSIVLTATNEAGNRNVTKSVKIMEKSSASNLFVGGAMTDATKWAIASQGKTQPTFTWNSSDAPSGASSALKIVNQANDGFVLYQPVYLTTGKTYALDFLVKDLGNNVSNVWMQAFVSNALQPNDVTDITDSGIITENDNIGQLNTWNGNFPAGFNGSFAGSAQKGSNHSGDICKYVPLETGMYYLIFRIGTWGGNLNISISNLSLTEDAMTTSYPGTNSEIRIRTSSPEDKVSVTGAQNLVELYSLTGRKLMTKKAGAETVLNTASLSNGVYLLVIDSKYSYKLVR